MAQVAVEFTGDEARYLRSLIRIAQAEQQQRAGLAKTEEAGKRVGDSLTKAFDPAALLRFAGVAGAGGVLFKGLQLLRAEFENIRDVQKQAFGEQATLYTAQANLIRNLGAVSAQEARKAMAAAAEISRRTLTPQAAVTDALASAYSASAGRFPIAAAAVEQAAKLFPDDPGQLREFAGSLVHMEKVTGTADAARNAGFLSAVGQLSAVTEPRQQAKNIPPALIGLKAFGASPEEAGALFAAISGGAADIEGAISGTGSLTLAQKVREFAPGIRTGRQLLGGFRGGAAMLPPTFGQGLEMLQTDPALARAFLDTAKIEEKKVRGPIEQLALNPRSEVARAYREGIAQLRGTDPRAVTANIEANLLAPEGAGAINIQRAFSSSREQLLTRRPELAEASAVREGLLQTLQASGQSSLVTKLEEINFEARGGLSARNVAQAGVGILENRIADIEQVTQPRQIFGRASDRRTVIPGRELNEQESQTVNLLRQLVDELKAINSNTAESARRGGGGAVGVATGEDE